MPDPAPDPAQPSAAAEHVPWDSIGAPEEAGDRVPVEASGCEDPQLPLTPWAEQSTAPEALSLEAPDPSPSPAEAIAQPPSAVVCRQADIGYRPVGRTQPRAAVPHDPDPPPDYRARRVEAASKSEEAPSRGGAWTLPVLCAGIALIACCVLIPQADSNRRLAYERELLQRDLQTVNQQISVNAEFLKKVADDPELAQRLAERQMKVIPEGVRVLDLTHEPEGMSPFQLVNVAPPPPLAPYRSTGGTIARLCYGTRSRLYLIGISLGMIATGLVLGATPPRDPSE
jgi:hypothetical protein